MKPSSIRASLVLGLVLSAGSALLALGRVVEDAPLPRTVILVRHAEKDPAGDSRDPSLSAAGQARASALADLLSRSKASLLLASDLKRTQETLAPLAAKLGCTVEKLPAAALDDWAARIGSLAPGATAVVAGHSNTVPAIAARLGAALPDVGAGPSAALADADYDRVFVLTLPPEGTAVAPAVLELRLVVD